MVKDLQETTKQLNYQWCKVEKQAKSAKDSERWLRIN